MAKTKPAAKSKSAPKAKPASKSKAKPAAKATKTAAKATKPTKARAAVAKPAAAKPAPAPKPAAPPPRAGRPTLEIKAIGGSRTMPPTRLAPAAPPARQLALALPPPPPPVDHAARMGELWRRLETWVASTGAPTLALAPGASEKAIAAAEKTMKLAFPPDVRASLAIHDGQTFEVGAPVFPWMPGCPPMLSIARIVERWKEEQDLAAKKQPKKEFLDATGKLKGGVYRTGRIPLAGPADPRRRDGERTFLDMDPGPAGTKGQLITMVSATDFVVIDASFAAAFERWVNVLERGLWIYDAAHATVHPRALAPASSHPSGLFSKR
jgi:cell wall assembly regulator SMI1